MGTALTGQTKSSSYDALLKTTDNGPITGSLKVVTDGLGNDSALSLSNAAVSVDGVALLGASAAQGAERLLVLNSADSNTYALIRNNDTGTSAYAGLILNANGNSWSMGMGSTAANSNALDWKLDALGTPATKMSLTSTGLSVTGGLEATVGTLGSMGCREVTISASSPTGGSDGDIWFQYV